MVTGHHLQSLGRGMLADELQIPFVSFASHLSHDGQNAEVTRDIEGGVEVVQITGPFVVSASKGLAEQRIPNMRGIMMAKRKPMQVIEAIEVENPIELVSFEYPEAKKGIRMIDPENMDELVRLLKEEAKVI